MSKTLCTIAISITIPSLGSGRLAGVLSVIANRINENPTYRKVNNLHNASHLSRDASALDWTISPGESVPASRSLTAQNLPALPFHLWDSIAHLAATRQKVHW